MIYTPLEFLDHDILDPLQPDQTYFQPNKLQWSCKFIRGIFVIDEAPKRYVKLCFETWNFHLLGEL